jgi:hypothetical protein
MKTLKKFAKKEIYAFLSFCILLHYNMLRVVKIDRIQISTSGK